MEDKFFKAMSFFIGVAFYGGYLLLVGGILDQDLMDFPYAILTVYFLVALFTFPLVTEDEGEISKDLPATTGHLTLIIAYIISPIIVLKRIKNRDDG